MAESSLYPGALDDTNLYEVVARLSTTLTADIAADTTTIPLAATTGFPTKGYIVIDNETIKYISVSVGSVDATDGRGHAGTAASHTNTTQVLVAVTAAVINKLRAGMIAIQTYAGTSGGTQGGINAKYLGGSTENQLSPIYLGGSTEGQLNVGYLGGSTNTEFVNVAVAQAITGAKTFKKTVQTINTATDGATVTFDLSLGNIQQVTLGGNRTLALSNVSIGQCSIIKLIQDATGSRTVTWFTVIRWADGVVPTLTTTAERWDVFGFICKTSGNYDGFIVGQNMGA